MSTIPAHTYTMTDTTTTRTDAPDRLVLAPEGMVWFVGCNEIPAEWVNETELDDADDLHLPVEVDGFDRYVRVPADEPASKADLMSLAADVADLKDQLRTLITRLAAASAALDEREA